MTQKNVTTQTQKWILLLKTNIQKKYNVTDPVFSVNGQALTQAELNTWLEDYALSWWIKYKPIKDSLFELKPFSPDPDDAASKKLIKTYLDSLPMEDETLFTISYFDEDLDMLIKGDSWYDREEAETELLFLFKQGKSKVSSAKAQPSLTGNKNICHLFVEQDSLEAMVQAGYLTLENTY